MVLVVVELPALLSRVLLVVLALEQPAVVEVGEHPALVPEVVDVPLLVGVVGKGTEDVPPLVVVELPALLPEAFVVHLFVVSLGRGVLDDVEDVSVLEPEQPAVVELGELHAPVPTVVDVPLLVA